MHFFNSADDFVLEDFLGTGGVLFRFDSTDSSKLIKKYIMSFVINLRL